ncbi:MAG: hypothetical protein U1E59_19705 [Amaricoccus sp.]
MPEVTSPFDFVSREATRGILVDTPPPEPSESDVKAAARTKRAPDNPEPDPVDASEVEPEPSPDGLADAYVRGVVEGLVDAVGRSRRLPDDVRELFRWTGGIAHALERARIAGFEERASEGQAIEEVTASMLFVAAVLCAREVASAVIPVPPAAERLNRAVTEGLFREIFVEPLLGGDEHPRYPRNTGPFNKVPYCPSISAGLQRKLATGLRDVTAESVLLRIPRQTQNSWNASRPRPSNGWTSSPRSTEGNRRRSSSATRRRRPGTAWDAGHSPLPSLT